MKLSPTKYDHVFYSTSVDLQQWITGLFRKTMLIANNESCCFLHLPKPFKKCMHLQILTKLTILSFADAMYVIKAYCWAKFPQKKSCDII